MNNPEGNQELGNKSLNLLLKGEMDFEKAKPDYKVKLDSLFEIFVGFSESKFQEMAQIEDSNFPVPVRFVRLINANPDTGRLTFDAIGSKSKSEKILNNDIKPLIPEDKLLNENDYLVNIRNRPAGYSMLNYKNENQIEFDIQNKFVASNQFIVFRPRDTVHYNVRYLHKLILDPLVKFVLGDQIMFENARSDAWIRKISEKDLRSRLLEDKNLEFPFTDLFHSLLKYFFKKEGNKYIKKTDKEIFFPEARQVFKEYETAYGKKDTFSFNSLKVLDLRLFEVMVHVNMREQDEMLKELEAFEVNLQEAQAHLDNYKRKRIDHLREQLGILPTMN